MEQALRALEAVDAKLDTINVKGVDAYTMVDARKLLRVAYDELKKEVDERVSNDAE